MGERTHPDPQREPTCRKLTTNINTLQSTTSKYAYATLFTEGAEREEDDKYLICTRMLTYQLLHDPATRTERSIPFIVLVPPSVSHLKRHRLQSEGATVVEVPTTNFSWMKPGRDRWAHVMDKLNVYKLVQFGKILLLDSDTVIFKRLDDIFESPTTEIRTNLGNSSHVKHDEGPQPQTYLMAGETSPEEGIKHSWPAKRRASPVNAGFVVLHPSEEMYEYNVRIASIEGRFPSSAPEQNLWNYIHRPDGNMPWKRIEDTWVMDGPRYENYENGIAAVHEKWFRRIQEDKALREELRKRRWEMEGFRADSN
ncbi:hypothetical protein CBER1_10360 [Cercospora berteroae]|uniref:Nucleotide-diphospho-sugar transferase n=1 Tax=Cercospora berteroae TaxID=357750 RepID=A0A2S6BXH8_9PEZI|nr:hypothetical protein CBER1_10360 [Cercospora berteroae]